MAVKVKIKSIISAFFKSHSRLARCGKIFVSALFLFIAFFLFLRFSPYGDLKKFLSNPVSTRIYDRSGELLQILSLDEGLRREFVPLEKMPEVLPEIFVMAEDRRFYKHHGVDIGAIVRAAFQNASERRTVSGASTITMQLARIISPSPRRTLVAKIFEAYNALRLEARFSKKQILEMYLNNVPFGFNTEGVASASRTFFNTSVENLSVPQIFCLAVIPRRPSYYNPFENPDACSSAAHELYLSVLGEIKDEDASYHDEQNQNEQNNLQLFLNAAKSAKSFRYPFEMPHYIRYLSGQNIGLYEKPDVTISAILSLQREAENLLAQRVEKYSGYRLTNGAVLVSDTRTGEILVWVGSSDFSNDANNGQVDGVLSPVQPGSSMKPFLYALALEHGYTPASVLPDTPLEFGFEQLYIPQNFNNRYNGPVRLRVALASSLNVPAVYLLNELGMDTYRKKLAELKFNSLEGSDPGLALALGGGSVSLYEMVQAFSVFPRDGKFLPLMPTSPSTQQPSSAKKNSSDSGQLVYSRDTSRLICDILSDKDARAMGFGYSQTFVTPFPSMFKTGTANQFQNITALCATPLYTVGVWMGNFSGETVVGQTGSSIPASIAKEIIMRLHGNTSKDFAKPSQLSREKICALSGMKAGQFCTGTLMEYLPSSDTAAVCDWHTASGVVYPAEYSQWHRLRNRSGSISDEIYPLEIISPRNGSVFFYDASLADRNQKLAVEIIGGAEENALVVVEKTSASKLQIAKNQIEKSSFALEKPFSFQIELERGEYKVTVTCGKETATLQYIVK